MQEHTTNFPKKTQYQHDYNHAPVAPKDASAMLGLNHTCYASKATHTTTPPPPPPETPTS